MKKILFSIGLVFLLLAIPFKVNASTLNVTRYQQEKSNWCWAATARMIGKYVANTSLSQTQIVTYVKGSAVNSGGSDSEVNKAITIATGNRAHTTYTPTIFAYSEFSKRIGSGRPVGIKMSWNSGGAHALAVSGALDSSQNIRIVDPAVGCSSLIWRSYSGLVNGGSVLSGSGKLTKIWANTL